ncbi:MAG: ribosome silencing factor [Alphaproteobacteria bacterium]|nr:ribosome silencing factor [Rhodospirillales bacterium]MCW9045966.1 ribosome silencing factor [Alphaproteobacteria bacterium]
MVQSLDDDKAQEIVTIDLVGVTPIADYLIIASGTSSRQVGAMANHLNEKLKAAGLDGISIEGMDNCDWVLIDAFDVVIHLFKPEVRDFYDLEKMWNMAEVTKVPQGKGPQVEQVVA